MNILALIPIGGIAGMPPYTPHAGSGKIACAGCGIACWIGPRQTVMKLEKPELPALCMLCACKEIQKQKESDEEVTASVIPLGD